MDNKLPNPHKREIEPNLIEEILTIDLKYRVVRMNGAHIVQFLLPTMIGDLYWEDAYDKLYQKPAIYPTLHEAENFICRHRKPEIHYYY
jgi:hypothetical protein